MNDSILNWLLNAEPWVEYKTRLDLIGQSPESNDIISAKKKMINNPQIKSLLKEVQKWPNPPLKRHNDASHPIHKLSFLTDIGIKQDNKILSEILKKIINTQADDGGLQILVNIPPRFGGTGEDQLSWMLCDSPLLLYVLLRSGMNVDKTTGRTVKLLKELVRDNGWPCCVSQNLDKFRGPGRKSDPCPYANLLIVKALSQKEEWRNSVECRIGAETLLNLWEHRKETKPYLFGMGTRFKKLKAPLIWYDILHVVDVLSRLPWLRKDERLQEMVQIIIQKANGEGKYYAESVWRAWGGWSFGQKKNPSGWITYLVYTIFKRMEIG